MEPLGTTLARLRRERDLTGLVVAQRPGISQGKISKIESSRLTPSPVDVCRIVGALGLAGTEVTEFVERSRQAQAARWERTGRRDGAGPGARVSVDQRDYLDEEGRARYLPCFEPTHVPSLPQASEYSRRVFNRSYAGRRGDPGAAPAAAL
ncbi:helix-turn-helix domain-containing protein [Frankia sp. AgB1.9]|uniref:helix-turn-helix domain-containing protein n=1 Tax=unclassified Frankia TaxID=2632575 RepID=UPI00193152A8|nr:MULTISPECIES: helix-turn-helix transcriptional regulator [unclassified Frankia]MBL7552397.1 helix-turn-helix domain-containing protein [Frankia sp. AgB1.9]